MPEWTLCEIIKGRRILLKMATRGVSRGKWNGLGGKIEKGETPEENIMREVYEESGLVVKKLEKVGRIHFYRGSRKRTFGIGHLFIIREFGGKARSTEEGRVRWFDFNEIPYERMWDDDRYWLPHLINGLSFDSEFVYDKDMGKVIEAKLSNIRKGRASL